MAIPVTTAVACLLGLLFLILEGRVIRLRWRHRVSLGSGEVRALERAIRGHGNLVEHAPLYLALSLLAEMQGASFVVLATAGAAFVIGRYAHGICFAFLRANLILRMGGMILTLLSFAAVLAAATSVLL